MSVESIKYDDICDKCVHGEYCIMATFGGHNQKITACYKFTERKQTNADRIRSMTDEELAKWIESIECNAYDLHGTYGADYWLDWLKQGAE